MEGNFSFPANRWNEKELSGKREEGARRGYDKSKRELMPTTSVSPRDRIAFL